MKRKRVGGAAIALVLLASAILLCVFAPRAPKVDGGFPEMLSQAQRKEIPVIVRKEMRRRIFAPLKRGQFKAAWTQYRLARSQRILAVGYQPANTNKIWVYLGNPSSPPGSRQSGVIPMTNTNGHWQITSEL